MIRLATLLLLVGGAMHALPPVANYLSALTGGTPFISVLVGLLSVWVGLGILWESKAHFAPEFD